MTLPASIRRVRAASLRWQSNLFEALAEHLFARGYLVQAAEYDDLETACERRGYAELAKCRCGAGQQALPWFRRADQYDRAERFDGYALAGARYDASAAFIRGVSTDVDAVLVALHSGRSS